MASSGELHPAPGAAGASAPGATPALLRLRSAAAFQPRWGLGRAELLIAALGLVYLVFFGVHLHGLIQAIDWNSDSVAPFVLTELHHHGDAVFRGTHGSWTATWWYELTRGLPGHRQIWELTSTALALVATALIAAGTLRAEGRRAAVVVAALVLAFPGKLVQIMIHADAHTPTFANTALLGLYLLALTRRKRGLVPAVASGVVVGAITGADVASDTLLLPVGLGPFAVGALAVALTGRAKGSPSLPVAAGVTVVVSAIAAIVTAAVMKDAGWSAYPPAAVFLASGAFIPHLLNLVQTMLQWTNASFFGMKPGFTSLLSLACALLVLAALPIPAVVGWQLIRGGVHLTPQQFAYRVFWVAVWALTAGAVVLSATGPGPQYVVPMIFSVFALLPVLRVRLPRAWITAGVALFVAASVVGIAQARNERIQVGTGDGGATTVFPRVAPDMVRYLEREHATVGYAAYWEAASLTWFSKLRVHVFPIQQCLVVRHTTGLCAELYNRMTRWYQPQPHTKTFLIVDPAATDAHRPPARELGPPSAVGEFSGIRVYVFRYDIAGRRGARPAVPLPPK